MSFLLKTARLPVATSRVTAPAASARFSTSRRFQKGPADTAKDAVKTVDRTVSDAAVKGIDAAESATSKAKEVAGVKSGEVKGKAAEVTGEAKGKAAELEGKAKSKMQ